MVKIHSQNVRGMSDYNERRKIFTYFKDKKTDILCLQETHSVLKDEKFWKAEWGGTILFSHGQRNSRGVASLISSSTDCEVVNYTSDEEGRFIVCTIKAQNRYFVLSTVYALNHDSPEFYVSVFQYLSRIPIPEWIVGGDFNLTLDPKMDRKTHVLNPTLKKAALALKELMSVHNLHDVWRSMNPDRRRYSWHGRITLASRIDFFLVSQSLLQSIKKCDIMATPLSDHSAIFLELDFKENIRGKGFWKFNDLLLNDTQYKEKIEQAIDKVISKNRHEGLNPLVSWEMTKLEVVGQTLLFSSEKSKERNAGINDLQTRIDYLENKLDSLVQMDTNEFKETYQNLVNLKHDLDMIFIEKTAKIITGTKAHWYNEGEANSSYFFNLEKQKHFGKCMNRIVLDDGSSVTERGTILKEQKKFFEQVYQSQPQTAFTYVNRNKNKQLTDEERDLLEHELTAQDLHFALIWQLAKLLDQMALLLLFICVFGTN